MYANFTSKILFCTSPSYFCLAHKPSWRQSWGAQGEMETVRVSTYSEFPDHGREQHRKRQMQLRGNRNFYIKLINLSDLLFTKETTPYHARIFLNNTVYLLAKTAEFFVPFPSIYQVCYVIKKGDFKERGCSRMDKLEKGAHTAHIVDFFHIL